MDATIKKPHQVSNGHCPCNMCNIYLDSDNNIKTQDHNHFRNKMLLNIKYRYIMLLNIKYRYRMLENKTSLTKQV